jgi:hypothetical protein
MRMRMVYNSEVSRSIRAGATSFTTQSNDLFLRLGGSVAAPSTNRSPLRHCLASTTRQTTQSFWCYLQGHRFTAPRLNIHRTEVLHSLITAGACPGNPGLPLIRGRGTSGEVDQNPPPIS